MLVDKQGFFNKLFDFSFSSFIAPQVVGVLYILGLIAAALLALSTILSVLRFSFFEAIGSSIIALLGFFAYAIGLRVFLESIVAQIRTAESTRILAENVLNNAQNADLNS